MIISISRKDRKLLYHLTFSTVLLRIILEYIYKTQISTIYGYSGFQNNYNLGRAILSWIMLLSLLPFNIKVIKKPKLSSLIMFLLYMMNFLPGTILMTYEDLGFEYLWYIYYLLLFSISHFMPNKNGLQSNHRRMNTASIKTMALLFSLFVVFIWIYYANGRIQIGFDDLYSIRLEARDFGMPMILRYLLSSMKVLLPVIIVWNLKKKDYFVGAVFILIQFIMFFIDGQKTTLFSLIATIGGFLCLKKHSYRVKYIPSVISILGIISIIEYNLLHTFQISGILIRRVMFVPQQLNIRYYDFFTKNTPDFFRGSLLKIVGMSSPYGSIARTIGRTYSGNNNLAANNGLFSDAMANLGVIGVFIMPFAVVLMLRLLDKYSDDLSVDFLIGSAIALAIPLMSASFFTMFLSHGIIALVALFYFLPREEVRDI